MTPERYLRSYRSGYGRSSIESLADLLQAIAEGEDLWHGGSKSAICYSTMTGTADYNALTALGWTAGANYGSYGSEWMYVYSPHSAPQEEST